MTVCGAKAGGAGLRTGAGRRTAFMSVALIRGRVGDVPTVAICGRRAAREPMLKSSGAEAKRSEQVYAYGLYLSGGDRDRAAGASQYLPTSQVEQQ